jgi:hypothetical protein
MNKECGNCGHELKIHYNWFCPKCDEKAIEIGSRKVYDLFKLMYHMEANGFMSKQRYWREYILESYNISNDIYIDAYFGEGSDEEINKYHEEVRRILGIDYDDTVIMRVSW